MAISQCEKCKGTTFKRTSVDSTGTLAVCVCGHWNFEDSGSDGGAISTGRVSTNGVSAIGNGTVAIGHTGTFRRRNR
ncbi:hypothetical protein GA0074692_2847 [Micromonospora pallida]|uniref:Uncharacterized protein n=1 Tax=Micromonospora pallida TaxID=145854 RepID=A0A1C6SKJ9_9ACTN|nr:hypothetical protein [Micromonospora pallida]SCL30031.1 hypothetical protein GA0074692_2847 [Micromonospora pallida]